jgi:predicted transcriptional regulator
MITVNQSILEMTKDLVRAQIEQGFISAERLQETLREIHYSLLTLKVMEDRSEIGELGPVHSAESTPASVDWRKSITKHAVTCLECGESFKQQFPVTPPTPP